MCGSNFRQWINKVLFLTLMSIYLLLKLTLFCAKTYQITQSIIIDGIYISFVSKNVFQKYVHFLSILQKIGLCTVKEVSRTSFLVFAENMDVCVLAVKTASDRSCINRTIFRLQAKIQLWHFSRIYWCKDGVIWYDL